MTDWGDRISARRRELGMTQVELATLCKVQPPSVNDWESGKTRSLKGTSLIAAARALKVDPEWITTGRSESSPEESLGKDVKRRSEEPKESEQPPVVADHRTETSSTSLAMAYVDRVSGAHLSAGTGEIVWDFDLIERSHSFRADWMQEKGLRSERCKVWTVRGDSMEPRYMSGDVVLIDMSDRKPMHSKIFGLVGEDGLRIKQLRRTAGGWEMHSFNPDQTRYPPEPIIEDNYAIIGRVRWRGGDED